MFKVLLSLLLASSIVGCRSMRLIDCSYYEYNLFADDPFQSRYKCLELKKVNDTLVFYRPAILEYSYMPLTNDPDGPMEVVDSTYYPEAKLMQLVWRVKKEQNKVLYQTDRNWEIHQELFLSRGELSEIFDIPFCLPYQKFKLMDGVNSLLAQYDGVMSFQKMADTVFINAHRYSFYYNSNWIESQSKTVYLNKSTMEPIGTLPPFVLYLDKESFIPIRYEYSKFELDRAHLSDSLVTFLVTPMIIEKIW
jgi:hypothetical protein